MIPKGLFTQIVMIILAVSLIITYVQPTLTQIGEVQDSIEVYQLEREKVITVNSKLANLVSKLDSISIDDKRKLVAYMPDSIDVIAVPRDLLLISNQANVLYKDSSYVGIAEDSKRAVNEKTIDSSLKHEFMLSVEGTYSQFKTLFKLMEQNHYPLEVKSVNIQQIGGDFLSASIVITTYEYEEITNDKTITF